jgi:hypothetical protein
MNEEMYEEEDNDVPSQIRRLNALHGITGPLGERFQSSLAMQLGMREALSQALLRNQQYQNANANAEANGANFMNPMMQSNLLLSPQNMTDGLGNQQSWQQQQQQFPQHDRLLATPSAQLEQQQQMQPHFFPQNPNFTLQLDRRRSTMPMVAKDTSLVKSPSASLPSTPLNHITAATPSSNHDSPQQVPTPPHSASAYTPGQTPSAGSPLAVASKPSAAMQRFATMDNRNPLTLQLPAETQQILGMGFPMDNNYSPMMKSATSPTGAYSYHPNGLRTAANGRSSSYHDLKSAPGMMYSPQSFFHPSQQPQYRPNLQAPLTGLNQTISPSALQNLDSSFTSASAAMSSSTFADSSFDFGSGFSVQGSILGNGFTDEAIGGHSNMYSTGCTNGHGSGWNTPGLNAEPSWNPEDFIDFGQPST